MKRKLRTFLHRIAPTAIAVVALATVLLFPAHAWARAGGGEGYHGGGGGGHGGGGGGGDGIGFLIYLLIQLVFEHPVIGIPVVIILVLIFYYGQDQGKQVYRSNVIRRGAPVMAAMEKQAALARVRSDDPLFDESNFTGRVFTAFMKIQQAWCDQNLTPVRPFISDGVHERFLLQFQEQKEAGYHDHMEGIRVDNIAIAQTETDGVFDVIDVRVAAAAVDYRQSLQNGKRISGSTALEPFVEVWSFVRRRGAKSLSGQAGLIEGNCPNCGAPIEMNQSANCTHCKALLRSGEYDWVLAEITQEVEWDGSRPSPRPGTPLLRQQDPDFNAVELEDRASVIFWRKATADRIGRIDPLQKMALPEFGANYAAMLRPQPNGRFFFGDCAVGSVQLLGVVLSEPLEKAVLEIRWSGKRFAAVPGGPPRQVGDESLFHTLFVLSRRAGSKTDIGKGISSAHCPNCGAPDEGDASDACLYCGTVLNDGSHGWVLSDVTARSEPRGQELLAQLRAPAMQARSNGNGAAMPVPDRLGMLAWMVNVAAADRNIDDRERQTLAAVAAGQNVAPDALDRMLAAARGGTIQAPRPADAEEARAWLSSMADTALADGNLTNDEFRVLCDLGGTVGLGVTDVKLLINRVKAQRYETAVRALRARRENGDSMSR